MITESYKTFSFTNCVLSRNHDIGCDCLQCRSCRDDILKFYQEKEKTRLKIRSIRSKSVDYNIIRSKPIPIPIPKSFQKESTYNNNYMTFNSLPNMYEKKSYFPISKNVIDNKCIICNKNYNNKLINNFYYLCEVCYITHELQ